MVKLQVYVCTLIVTLLATLPTSAQVEVPVKPSRNIASGKFVRFLPLLLIHKDDTFLNSPTKKGEVPQTLLMVEPYSVRLRDGSQMKRLALNVSGQVTEGPSVRSTAFLTTSEADLLLTRLNDARRVAKRWEALKGSMPEDEKERSVVFNPHPDVQVRVEMVKNGTLVWAMKIKDIISIGFIPDLSQTINQVEMSTKWLKTGKLPPIGRG